MYILATHIYIVKEKVSLAANGQFIPPPKRWGTSCPFRLKGLAPPLTRLDTVILYNSKFILNQSILLSFLYLSLENIQENLNTKLCHQHWKFIWNYKETACIFLDFYGQFGIMVMAILYIIRTRYNYAVVSQILSVNKRSDIIRQKRKVLSHEKENRQEKILLFMYIIG